MRVRGISIQALIVVRIECPADASFVVVDTEDAETCEPGGDLALIIGVPVPVKTHWIVACAFRSKWLHSRASSIFFFWEAKVCQKTLIITHSFAWSTVLLATAGVTFIASINDHRCCSKSRTESPVYVILIGFVELGCYLVNRRLWALWHHVKPHGWSKRLKAIFANYIRIV